MKEDESEEIPKTSTDSEISSLEKIGNPNGHFLQDETYAIIGAAYEVYYKLGCGFSEPVYQEALEIELRRRCVPFESQKRLLLSYKGNVLRKGYRVDLLCFDQIVVEIKAISQLTSIDWSQVLHYLKASQLRVGLLFNFGNPITMEKKRIVV